MGVSETCGGGLRWSANDLIQKVGFIFWHQSNPGALEIHLGGLAINPRQSGSELECSGNESRRPGRTLDCFDSETRRSGNNPGKGNKLFSSRIKNLKSWKLKQISHPGLNWKSWKPKKKNSPRIKLEALETDTNLSRIKLEVLEIKPKLLIQD